MAKKPHEMLPHQYGAVVLKNIPHFREKIQGEFGIRFIFSKEYLTYNAAIDSLQGKGSYHLDKVNNPNYSITQKEVDVAIDKIRLEHAQHLYAAIKVGIKVHNRILSKYPDLNEMAKENDWDSLPPANIKESGKKESKPVPTREDPEDKFAEQFTKEDKEKIW